MKYEKLSEALSEISDTYVAEAAASKKKIKPAWLGAVAAMLILAIALTAIGRPMTASAEGLIAAPEYPELAAYSENNWAAWWEDQVAQYDQPEGYADGTEEFFRRSIAEFLQSGDENIACSPLNVYMALAMLAESTGGQTQQQVLELLGADNIDVLRTQAGHIWNAHYRNDSLSTTTLASSVWLNEGYSYNQDTVNTLSDSYYASVYQGDLGGDNMIKALRDWLNEQTGGLLEEQAGQLELDPECVLALVATIYYRAQWCNDFNEVNNYDDVFYAPAGEVSTTYMFQRVTDSPYYWGEDFGAVHLRLEDGSKMWLILPNEDKTAADVLGRGEYLDLLFAEDYENSRHLWIELSLPKFDIASDLDLINSLQNLGITDVFDHLTADFTPIMPDEEETYLAQVSHAARVAVDEDGVTAASYTVMAVNDAAADIVDATIEFTLNRPFIMLIESRDGLPLFAGVVNQP